MKRRERDTEDIKWASRFVKEERRVLAATPQPQEETVASRAADVAAPRLPTGGAGL